MKDIEIFSTKNNGDLIGIFKDLSKKTNSNNKIKFMVLEREIIFWLCPNIPNYEHRDGLIEYERNKHYKHKEFGGGYIKITNENNSLKISFQDQSLRYKHPKKTTFLEILNGIKNIYNTEDIQFTHSPEYIQIWEKEKNEFLRIHNKKLKNKLIKSFIAIMVLIVIVILFKIFTYYISNSKMHPRVHFLY